VNDRTVVSTPDAPAAIGPYSQAVRHGDLLYCSGALPLDPDSGELRTSSLAVETEQCIDNLAAVCAAAGAKLGDAVRMTIYTTALDRFAEINETYGRAFEGDPPARVTVGVAALPKGAQIEIDAIVAVG
jgi:2-iminobutanoate/2-iminopropanoate deaminase